MDYVKKNYNLLSLCSICSNVDQVVIENGRKKFSLLKIFSKNKNGISVGFPSRAGPSWEVSPLYPEQVDYPIQHFTIKKTELHHQDYESQEFTKRSSKFSRGLDLFYDLPSEKIDQAFALTTECEEDS